MARRLALIGAAGCAVVGASVLTLGALTPSRPAADASATNERAPDTGNQGAPTPVPPPGARTGDATSAGHHDTPSPATAARASAGADPGATGSTGAPASSPQARSVIDPADVLRLGSRDPLTPPEIRVDVAVSDRGNASDATLVPPVVTVDSPSGATPGRSARGAATTGTLVPPVVTTTGDRP